MKTCEIMHYFSEKPESAHKEMTIEGILRNKKLIFKTDTGIFSPKKIDKGTKILVEALELNKTDDVLDIGCGYGVVGIAIADEVASITMTDINKRAVKLAKENIKTFIEKGVKKIIVSSPHCYHTFKNEYPEFMVNFEIVHMSQFMLDLINEGRLEITGKYEKKVTYHDPCYLGRHNNMYDEPRMVLKSIPGLELVEMADSGRNSLCCGGGGGRIWMDTPKEERFSDLRLKQAHRTGSQVLATACPYCITNFEESRLNLEYDDILEIKDITEIVQEVI